MERKTFLRSLVPTASNDLKRHGPPERKAYLRDLAKVKEVASGGGDPEPGSSNECLGRVVFDIKALRDFKAGAMQTSALDRQGLPPRKRPNYDNSNRKLRSNPKHRIKFLVGK